VSETDLACSACHRTLPIEQFKPGRNRCRQCRKASYAAWYATPEGKAMRAASNAARYASPEGKAMQKASAAYRASPEGKAMRKASNDAYRATPEGAAKRAASDAAYRATPEGAAKRAAYDAYRASPEGKAMRKASDAAYLATPEGAAKRAAYAAAYRASPEGKAVRKASYAARYASPEGKAMRKASDDAYLATPGGKAMKQIQRHRRRGGMTEGSATPAVFQKMSEVKKCPYCGRKRPPGSRFHIDHIWPLRLGGWNAAWNYVACCRACNLKKGKLSPLAWLEKLSPEHRTSAERAWNKVNRLWRDPPLARADRALVTSTCPPNRR